MKNKYEKLFDKILGSTKNKEMKWVIVSKDSYSHLIFNSNLVYRIFESDLIIEESSYKVLFTEKKYLDTETELYDQHQAEVLILEDDNIVTSLNESVIDRSDLYKLLSEIEENNDKANKLFNKL